MQFYFLSLEKINTSYKIYNCYRISIKMSNIGLNNFVIIFNTVEKQNITIILYTLKNYK